MKVEIRELLEKPSIKECPISLSGENPEIEFAYNFKGDLKDVHNALVLFSPKRMIDSRTPYENGFKDCLILLDSRYMLPLTEGDSNTYIVTNTPVATFDSVVKEYRLDPYEVDENHLKFRRDYKEMVIIDRASFEESPKIGMFTQIGKTGDVFDEFKKATLSIGGVLIEDDVIIGNNVTIYRGLTGYTVIKKGTILSDNCVVHHDAIVNGFIKSFSEIYE